MGRSRSAAREPKRYGQPRRPDRAAQSACARQASLRLARAAGRMVLTMADWTEAELAALRRAYASGTTRVSYDGKTVEYGSAADLLVRIRTIERQITGRT